MTPAHAKCEDLAWRQSDHKATITQQQEKMPGSNRCCCQVMLLWELTVGKDVGHVSTPEGLRVALDIALCKLLHEPVDLLSLSRQAEASQEAPAGQLQLHSSAAIVPEHNALPLVL